MKILALLIALFISHFRPGVARLRDLTWLSRVPELVSGQGPAALPMSVLIAVCLLAGSLAVAAGDALLGDFGVLLVGLIVVIYTLGPRDLDRDLSAANDDGDLARQHEALEHLQLRTDMDGAAAAAATLHAALSRWFGIVLWFVVLGAPGALLYRGIREAYHHADLKPSERHWLGRLLAWINWPVMLALVGAIALVTDFDRVRAVFRGRPDRWELPPALLDDLTAALCAADQDLAGGLADGRQLAWRALILWLVVVSLLLIAGWVQ